MRMQSNENKQHIEYIEPSEAIERFLEMSAVHFEIESGNAPSTPEREG